MALDPCDMTLRTGEPVSFRFKDCLLYGMLHHPPVGTVLRETGIVILNPGATDRNGPHRLYLKLAAQLAMEGYPVLWFDARGVGESEGEWAEGIEGSPIRDVFTQIQKGIWTPDTGVAIDFIISRTGVRHVVLGGLCGGAITALLAGAEHSKVTGMFMIGTPITLSSETTQIQDLPESFLAIESNLYLKKLLRLSAWVRLLTFQTDYKTLWEVLISRFRSRTKSKVAETEQVKNPKLSPLFLTSFKSAIDHGKKMIFVYAENDYLWYEFNEYFLPSFGSDLSYPLEIVTIPHANHNLTEIDWQEKLNSVLLHWLADFTNPLSSGRK